MQGPGFPVRMPTRRAGTGVTQTSVGFGHDTGPAESHNAGHRICVASPRRVLIVDDNDRHLDILSAILAAVGYDVDPCGSGAEALRRLTTRLYDVVVLDLVMPEVSGVTVAREMRNCGLNTLTPVVVCTANVTIASSQLAATPGIHAVIGKPINTAELVLAVASAPAVVGNRAAAGPA